MNPETVLHEVSLLPKLSVVIPTYNDPMRLRMCLAGFMHQVFQDFDLCVVNDGGDHESTMCAIGPYLMERKRWMYAYLDPPSTQFRAGQARNHGLQFVYGDRVLFMDSDVIPAPNLTEIHAKYGDQKEIVLGRVRRVSETVFNGLMPSQVPWDLPGLSYADDRRIEMKYPAYMEVGANVRAGREIFDVSSYRLCWSNHMSVPLNLTRSIGGFWEKFVGFGNEDQELGMRLMRAGCKLKMDFTAVGYHLDHPLRGDPYGPANQLILRESEQIPSLIRNGGPILPAVLETTDVAVADGS